MKKQQLKAGIASVVMGVISPIALLVPSAHAATVTWAGGDSNSMNSGLNWVAGGILVSGDTAVFPATALFEGPNNDMAGLSLAKLVFNGENTGPSSDDFTITGNDITLTQGIDAVMTGSGGDHQVKLGITLGANATFKTTGVDTLAIGDTDKVLDLGDKTLTLQADGGSISIIGKVKGSGKIVKSGTGKVVVNAVPGTGGYTGSFDVTSGEFSVDNNVGVNVTVAGGKLKGVGTVGKVTMTSGAIAPGNSPGVINTGDLAFTGGAFDVELGGTGAGQFDQTNVTGTVDLGSATDLTIALVNSFAPAVGDKFMIISNDGTDAIAGTFLNMKEGAKATLDSYTYQISYKGGDGNDAVLSVTGTPSAPDTGAQSFITSPMTAIVAALLAVGAIGTNRYLETRKK